MRRRAVRTRAEDRLAPARARALGQRRVVDTQGRDDDDDDGVVWARARDRTTRARGVLSSIAGDDDERCERDTRAVDKKMTLMLRSMNRRGAVVMTRAKKSKRGGGGGKDDYSSDFALYGSFDEDYGEGAGLLLGKQELRGGAGVGRGKKKAGYDAVAGVLDALAAERKTRRSSSGSTASGGGYANRGGYDDGEDVEDKEAGIVGAKDVTPVDAPAAKAAAPAPVEKAKAKPKPAAKPKQAEDVDPVSTTAKAAKTLQKWGFADADASAALDAVSASVGDAATAKKRQVAALDWLLANCEFHRVPDEYKLEAQQARA